MADVVMADAPSEADGPDSPKPLQSVEIEPAVKQEDAANDGSENDANEAQDAGGDEKLVSTEQYKALKAIAETLTEFKIKKGSEDYFPSNLFKRVPNKRNLPEYYDIIKEPSAISTLKGKIQRKQYTGVPEFVRDFALIVHNAQVFNKPNSQPVKDVLQLETVFKEELQKLVETGLVKQEDTAFPDLGPIPAATPEPDRASEVEEEEEAEEDGEDDEEEEEEGDDSDDDRRKRRGRRGGRTSISGRKQGRDEDEEAGKGKEADDRKRRGRPPKVDTPMEARIKAVLKGLRKPKDDQGNLRVRHFERLPDKMEYPHYYQEIKEPIALDTIKKRSKRKKYTSLDHFMKDVDTMFKNAMAYNEDSSVIYQDAQALHEEAKELADAERKKPDDDYLMEDGRLPLPDGILSNNELWKVGDWIHIQNPNDVTKPIVAQIYRTWQDAEGQKWINACWYYRPEQTVHQYEKHFFPDEVVKTGQYRDHRIDEVVDRCFVMFFTRFSRGRPRGFDVVNKKVYVCEARYNEEKHKFNKIKTWASCLPDEVRDKDYEMDLWPSPQKIKKIPSPLLHLLKDDVKETDEVPSPQWRDKNAPPIIGAIHKQPRDENQSPPPEPTPPPPTPPPAPVRAPSSNLLHYQQPRPSMDRQSTTSQSLAPQATPQAPNHSATSVSPAPPYGRLSSFQQPGAAPTYVAPQTPAQQQSTPYVAQLHQPSAHSAAHPVSYTGATPSVNYNRPAMPPTQPPAFPVYPASNIHEPRSTEVYVLSDSANEAIPKDIRQRYPQDDQGRVLFFAHPPVDTRHLVSGRSEAERGKPLEHSEKYLKAKEARLARIKELKAETIGRLAKKAKTSDYQNPSHGFFGEERDENGVIVSDPVKATRIRDETEAREKAEAETSTAKEKADLDYKYSLLAEIRRDAMGMLIRQMNQATADTYRMKYGDRALEFYDYDCNLTKRRQERERIRGEKDKELQKQLKQEEQPVRLDQEFWTGKYPDGTGRYEDDFDNRLPRYP